MHTATADPLVGRTLEGRYRIVDRIARGGMSTVYSAVDERLDRLVAVKVMSAALSADPAFVDRFAREARAAARLSHLNTVAVFDQGIDTTGGSHSVFLVMELVDGRRTLRDLLRERGRLEPAEALSIMEPVLSALAAAHRAGLVHRDVKPENILLSDEGIVKVADFGLARAVEADAASTRTGLMMGTVAYCSPEQISKGRADQRSDVYSAGVVFFELLTGSPPFSGDSAMNVAYQHVHNRVPAPSSRVKGIPSEIDELIVNATDSDPAGRPADAGAFLAELADVRAELALPVVAIPPRPRTGTSNGRAAVTDVANTEVVRGAASDTSVVPRRPGEPAYPPPIVTPPPKRRTASPRARRRRRALIALVVLVLAGLLAGYVGWWFASGRYATVPDVTGQSQAVAVADLRHAGYQVSSVTRTEFSDTVPAGRVVATDPAHGHRVTKGRTITLIVSKGPQLFTLPSVVNLTEAQARQKLATLPIHVVATASQRSSDTVPAGKVIGTDPPANSQVKHNQDVTILVSTGPPIIPVPPIAPGTPLDQAQQTLQNAGFKTTTVDQFSDSVAKGTVISVDPSTEARKFSTVTITVSKGPQQVVIPDFGSLPPLDEVQKKLTDLGLVVKVDKAFGGHAGRVVGIDPASGTTVDVGSTVTVTVV